MVISVWGVWRVAGMVRRCLLVSVLMRLMRLFAGVLSVRLVRVVITAALITAGFTVMITVLRAGMVASWRVLRFRKTVGGSADKESSQEKGEKGLWHCDGSAWF